MLELPTFHSEETASSLFALIDICRAMRLFFGQHSFNFCDEAFRRSLTFNSFLKRYSCCFGSCGCRFDERRMQCRASIAASGKDQPTNQSQPSFQSPANRRNPILIALVFYSWSKTKLATAHPLQLDSQGRLAILGHSICLIIDLEETKPIRRTLPRVQLSRGSRASGNESKARPI